VKLVNWKIFKICEIENVVPYCFGMFDDLVVDMGVLKNLFEY